GWGSIEGPQQASGSSFISPSGAGPPKTRPEKSSAIAVELPISIRGPRQSSPAGRRRPRLCARSSWRHQTLACGCRSSPHPVVSILTVADNVPNPVIVPPALDCFLRCALDDEPLGNVTPS